MLEPDCYFRCNLLLWSCLKLKTNSSNNNNNNIILAECFPLINNSTSVSGMFYFFPKPLLQQKIMVAILYDINHCLDFFFLFIIIIYLCLIYKFISFILLLGPMDFHHIDMIHLFFNNNNKKKNRVLQMMMTGEYCKTRDF